LRICKRGPRVLCTLLAIRDDAVFNNNNNKSGRCFSKAEGRCIVDQEILRRCISEKTLSFYNATKTHPSINFNRFDIEILMRNTTQTLYIGE